MKIPIYNIGQLRKAIEGLDDEMPVLSQVIGEEDGAWNMFLEGGVPDRMNSFVFQMSHPDLKRLPDWEDHLPVQQAMKEIEAIVKRLQALKE